MTVLRALMCIAAALITWPGQTTAQTESPLPASDPTNEGGWILNTDLSDEFNGTRIDHEKWRAEGIEGRRLHLEGPPPSQYAPHNVVLKDGFLEIRSQWEPDSSTSRSAASKMS